jgi:hypothetical protein
MKTHLISPKTASIMLAITGLALSAQAIPTLITGNISLSGTTTIDATSFLTATRFLSFQDVFVGGPSALSGDYVGTSGAVVTVMPYAWAPASTPVHNLWSFVSGGNTYSFDLLVLHQDFVSASGLLLSGIGTAHITGPGLEKMDTTGRWDLSAQSLGLSSFTYSSSMVIPPQSVPDDGTTVVLMGAALCGLAFMNRKRNSQKTC